MPSGNTKGCLRRELRLVTAYALQKRQDGQRFFSHGTGQSRGSEFRQFKTGRKDFPRPKATPSRNSVCTCRSKEQAGRKMRSRRSWQPQEGRTVERDNRLEHTTDLRSWEKRDPRKRAVSSERVCGGLLRCHSKKKVKTLHLLGSCYMIPGIDCRSFTFAGKRFPSRRTFHSVCKWCARAEAAQEPDDHSSDTVTSSSTEEAE